MAYFNNSASIQQQSMQPVSYYMGHYDISMCSLMEYIPSDWNSLYIPNLNFNFRTEVAITSLIQDQLCIGEVKRVDIVSKTTDSGGTRFLAFVHFNKWYKTKDTEFLRHEIATHGACDVYGYNTEFNFTHSFTDNHGRRAFMRFIRNESPIPETTRNVHQLAECLSIAEKTIAEQQSRIEALERHVISLIREVELVNSAVHRDDEPLTLADLDTSIRFPEANGIGLNIHSANHIVDSDNDSDSEPIKCTRKIRRSANTVDN